MKKNYLIIASLYGMAGVILGAFGTHGLEGRLDAEQESVYETAVLYQFIHVFAILMAENLANRFSSRLSHYAAFCFSAGILLFSGSLYLLACNEVLGLGAGWNGVLGPVTPLGGTLLIIGWGLLSWSLISKK